VVVNPRATATTARSRDVLIHALRGAAEVEIAQTANRGHAAALACRAMRARVGFVVALGGDGTVNEVVNGLLTDGVHDGVPTLGVVPAGSTNVFARALGLPSDPTEAVGALLDALRADRSRQVSLGRLNDRWFTFTAGIGFDAALIAAVERRRRRGERSTHALYARVGLREFFASDRRHPKLTIEFADGMVLEKQFYALVNNTDPWTYLGRHPMRPTPEASFDTGLALYTRRRMGAVGASVSLAQMLRRNPGWEPGATIRYDLPELIITASEPVPVQVDGDLLGARDKASFRSVRRALRVAF